MREFQSSICAWADAWAVKFKKAIDRALGWLGDYADGWES